MGDLCLLVADVLVKSQLAKTAAPEIPQLGYLFGADDLAKAQTVALASPQVTTGVEFGAPEFSQPGCQPQLATQIGAAQVGAAQMGAIAPSQQFATEIRAQEDNLIDSLLNDQQDSRQVAKVSPALIPNFTDIPQAQALAPQSGNQLYRQRLEALRAGTLYTRLASDSFYSAWSQAQAKPSYTQWKQLLALEARAVARGQGDNRLSVVVGDSLSLWFPSQRLPEGQLWLNQGISGDTTGGILQRLSAFAQTRPDTIYVMAGINDLRRGHSDQLVLNNLRQIMRQLHQKHPGAEVVVQSILPTRYAAIPSSRIRSLNQRIAAIAQQEKVSFLDLYPYFTDTQDHLNRALTTDGLHLNPRGYQVWQVALQQTESQLKIARYQRLTATAVSGTAVR
uniref:GDSL-type esterase/lipase family protein n=1 Tax=Trichocoleus desertorum TaxID=1481672 RepID=UPI0025B6254D|nr:GDSL-type esterase/lipase family protein [Trichocoleus desertorum]